MGNGEFLIGLVQIARHIDKEKNTIIVSYYPPRGGRAIHTSPHSIHPRIGGVTYRVGSGYRCTTILTGLLVFPLPPSGRVRIGRDRGSIRVGEI